MALFRALESQRRPGRRLFYDPLAKLYLSPMLRFVAAMSKIALVHRVVTGIIDRKWAGARTSGVARTRLIDEAVCKALGDGARQVVLLGAGFDSRAYRIPGMDSVAVFEVDHPATSALKRKLTRNALGSVPTNVRFVQTDFNRQALATVLEDAGYSSSLQTVFVWEGVSNYLTSEAVDSTLLFCSRAAPKSQLVFTYIDERILTDPQSFFGAEKIVKLLSDVGEKWTFGLDPQQLEYYLKQRGLKLEADLSAAQYRERYFKEGSLRMRGYEFYRVAIATVEKKRRRSER